MSTSTTEIDETKVQTTPWALAVAAGAGIMSFLVCRSLFKQSKQAAVIQTYIVASATFGALQAASKRVPAVAPSTTHDHAAVSVASNSHKIAKPHGEHTRTAKQHGRKET